MHEKMYGFQHISTFILIFSYLAPEATSSCNMVETQGKALKEGGSNEYLGSYDKLSECKQLCLADPYCLTIETTIPTQCLGVTDKARIYDSNGSVLYLKICADEASSSTQQLSSATAEQLTSSSAEPLTSSSAEQLTSLPAEQLTSSSAEQLTSSSAEILITPVKQLTSSPVELLLPSSGGMAPSSAITTDNTAGQSTASSEPSTGVITVATVYGLTAVVVVILLIFAACRTRRNVSIENRTSRGHANFRTRTTGKPIPNNGQAPQTNPKPRTHNKTRNHQRLGFNNHSLDMELDDLSNGNPYSSPRSSLHMNKSHYYSRVTELP